MKLVAWLLILLAAASGAAAARTILDVDVVAISADMDAVDRCTVGFDAELCVLRWYDNGTLEPGDDVIDVQKFVGALHVRVRPPGLPPDPHELVVDPSGLTLEHPLAPAANDSWQAGNSSLPAAAREYATLDSRPMQKEPYSWGLFATVHKPNPRQTTGGSGSAFGVGVCWNLNGCPVTIHDNTVYRTDEGFVQLLPESVHLEEWDLDRFARASVHAASTCNRLFLPPAACEILQVVSGSLLPVVDAYEALTPTVRAGLHVGGSLPPQAPERPSVAESRETLWQVDASLRLPTSIGWVPGTAEPQERERGPIGPTGIALVRGDPSSSRVVANPSPALWIEPGPWLGAWIAFAGGLALSAVWIFYTRSDEQDALDQATRRAIFALVSSEPGIRTGTVATRLELHFTTVRYHIGRLERAGLIRGFGRGQRRFFATSALPATTLVAADALATPGTRAVYAYLCGAGRDHLSGVSRALGMAPSSVRSCITQLEAAGLVVSTREGRRLDLRIASAPAESGASENRDEWPPS